MFLSRDTAVSSPIVHLFCDTNLLVQCQALEQLDWSGWRNHEVHLIVTKPVMRELDHQKNRGNSRIARRARTASATFRDMRPSGRKTVRSANPRVILCVDAQLRFDRDEKQLDFSERDDQLVGTLQLFANENPAEDARLLTHDTGPMYTADSLGLKVELIPDSWLLPPENDEHQKKINGLESELKRLRRSEPSLEIRFIDAEGSEAREFHGRFRWFNPLSDDEVRELVDRLRQNLPMADFKEADNKSPELRRAGMPTFSAALLNLPDPDAIAQYREQDYPQWLESCRRILSSFHHLLQWEQPALRFTFAASNSGIRPAEDALVTISAKGVLRILPPRESVEPVPTRLPDPPKPPRGGSFLSFDVGGRATLDPFLNPELNFDGSPLLRDRNKFYFRDDSPTAPVESYSLICDQWRHGPFEEKFLGEIHLLRADAQGALSLEIQAGNLSDPTVTTIPVRIKAETLSSYPRAEELVRATIKGEPGID